MKKEDEKREQTTDKREREPRVELEKLSLEDIDCLAAGSGTIGGAAHTD